MLISKPAVFALASSILLSAISGYAGASWAIRRGTAIPAALASREFVLVDEAGHVGARLAWNEHQPIIQMFDSTDHVRSALFLEPNGVPDLYLYDAHQKVRAALNLFDSGVPNLSFGDETGRHFVRTEYDKERSYNTVFVSYSTNAAKIMASRRIVANESGLHVRDLAENRKSQ